MHILHAIASIDPAGGGPVEALWRLVVAMSGHTAEVICLDPPGSHWLQETPCPVHALGPGKLSYQWSPHWIPWIRQEADRFDGVVVHGIWQFSSFGTYLGLRNKRVPYFVYPHGMLDPWFKHTYPLKHFKKSIYWCLAEFFVLSQANAVLFTCEEERILAAQSFWPYRCREEVVKLGTAAPSVDPDRVKQLFLDAFPELAHKRRILFLGRLHPKKGCDLLIQAFAQVCLKDETLHLVMAGPDQVGWQVQLEDLAKQLGIGSRITFTGLIKGDLKWGSLYTADVFVLPSHQENFGIAVVEALACQVPVLISHQVNIWREIQQAQAGFVAPDTLEGTVSLLQKWLSLSALEQIQIKSQAQACFATYFDIEKVAQNLIQVLTSHRSRVRNAQ
jgi:glycosyltransferase involved in cell wall biosynthesis